MSAEVVTSERQRGRMAVVMSAERGYDVRPVGPVVDHYRYKYQAVNAVRAGAGGDPDRFTVEVRDGIACLLCTAAGCRWFTGYGNTAEGLAVSLVDVLADAAAHAVEGCFPAVEVPGGATS